jgi:tetratricopeptide (TPR) repeat protein
LAKAQHKLIALDLRLRVDPKQRDIIVSRAINEWKDAAPADLIWLGSWLNAKGEFQKTLDTIPLSTAMRSRDLFLQHLDALAGLERWGDVKQLLSSEKFPLDPVVQQMYLARCSGQLGEKTATANSWQRALEAAAGDRAKLMALAGYAEKNGNVDIAGVAYDAAAQISPALRIAQQGRLRVAQARRDTRKLHQILTEMLALWPNDSAVQNDEAYTRLLLLPADAPETKHETVAIERLAESLIEREPASMPHRTLLALARLRQGRPEGALTVYSDLRVTQDALTNSSLTVHAAVLAATAHDEDAKTEAAQIKQEQLLPEERTLIESLLHQG